MFEDAIHRNSPKAKKIVETGAYIGQGAEAVVYGRPENENIVTKILTGTYFEVDTAGNFVHRNFDVDAPPQDIRLKLIQRHVLTKILAKLFPESVPDVSQLATKNVPTFSQDRIIGEKKGDVLIRDEAKISAYLAANPSATTNTGGGRFRIKEVIPRHAAYTAESEEEFSRFEEREREFKHVLQELGISVDEVNDSDNFIRSKDGNLFYIDNFMFKDVHTTTLALKNKIETLTDATLKKELEHLLARFEKMSATK